MLAKISPEHPKNHLQYNKQEAMTITISKVKNHEMEKVIGMAPTTRLLINMVMSCIFKIAWNLKNRLASEHLAQTAFLTYILS
jgi:hypothetical protein